MKHTYFNIPGWFNYSETYDVIVDRIEPNGKIIEIGSFLGRSTHYLATSLFNANKYDVQVYCIDTFVSFGGNRIFSSQAGSKKRKRGSYKED